MIETRMFLSQRQWLTVEKFADVFIEGTMRGITGSLDGGVRQRPLADTNQA